MAGETRSLRGEPSVILNGAALGSSVPLGGQAIVGLFLDAQWDPNIITFQASYDNINWFNVFLDDANTELQIPAATALASRALCYNSVLDKLAPFAWIRPRSGTSGAPVNQSGNTTIVFATKA